VLPALSVCRAGVRGCEARQNEPYLPCTATSTPVFLHETSKSRSIDVLAAMRTVIRGDAVHGTRPQPPYGLRPPVISDRPLAVLVSRRQCLKEWTFLCVACALRVSSGRLGVRSPDRGANGFGSAIKTKVHFMLSEVSTLLGQNTQQWGSVMAIMVALVIHIRIRVCAHVT